MFDKYIYTNKVVIVEDKKEETQVFYFYYFGKIIVFDTRKNKTIKIKDRIKKYDISPILKIAKKENFLLDFDLSLSGGNSIHINLKSKKHMLPIVDIDITNNETIINSEKAREHRLSIKDVKTGYTKKNIISKNDFYDLYAKKEDLSIFDKNPEVHLFFTINENIFIEIWGKKNDAERIAEKFNSLLKIEED